MGFVAGNVESPQKWMPPPVFGDGVPPDAGKVGAPKPQPPHQPSDNVPEPMPVSAVGSSVSTDGRRKRGSPRNTVTRGAEIRTKEIDTAMCENVDAADVDDNCAAAGSDAVDVDDNCAAAGSYSPSEIETLDEEKMPESSNDLHNNFESHKQAAEIKSNILEPERVCPVEECSLLIPVAPACLEDQSEFPFSESSLDDDFVCSASHTDENKTSSDGPSFDNCVDGWDLGDDRGEIIFIADYMYYNGAHYPGSVVSFSRSSVEVQSKIPDETKESFRFRLEIDDIVKIESQWSARLETGTISVFFFSKSLTHDHAASVSGIHELKFTAVDSDWYEKKEVIASFDVKYKALWNSLLDIGKEECSTLPDWEAKFTRSYFPKFDKSFDEVIYPKGDPDAVSISKRDIDLLQPNTFVNDTIIDFYIKYLKNRQNGEERVKFHFFNCFFFRKLADMDKDPSSAFDGKAAFQRVRKWTRKVNLLEKDFIFIPVNYNYHWSLIVVCYFGEVAKDTDDDNLIRLPCVLHMDSLRGTHMGLKDLMQSYLWEEWKERQKETCEDPSSKFRNLKFVSLELPQQQNLYDCGLFLLHYVELFLEEGPTNFNVHKITPSSNFLQADWFPPGEASMKRACIERLIHELLENCSEECNSSSESDTNHSQNAPTTTNYNENEHDIEMTLLPATQIDNIQCTRNSGLSLKNLFGPGYVSESFNGMHSRAFEQIESIDDELRRPVSPTKEEGEADEHFVHTGLAEPSFQQVDGLIPGATIFPYSSRKFRLEPDCEAMLEDVGLYPAPSSGKSDDVSEVDTDEKCQSFEAVGSYDKLGGPRCVLSENIRVTMVSGDLAGTPESCSLVGIGDQNEGSLHLKNLPEFYEETNQIQGNGPSSLEILPCCPPFASGGALDATECVSPYGVVNSTDQAYPPTLDVPISLTDNVDGASSSEACEFHAAKKMRVSHPNQAVELTCDDLSKDLHL